MLNKFLIIKPLVTEKSSRLARLGQYVFLVKNNATVSETKKLVSDMYKVKVKNARSITIPSVRKSVGRFISVRPSYKKMIVTLNKGEKLDIIPQ